MSFTKSLVSSLKLSAVCSINQSFYNPTINDRAFKQRIVANILNGKCGVSHILETNWISYRKEYILVGCRSWHFSLWHFRFYENASDRLNFVESCKMACFEGSIKNRLLIWIESATTLCLRTAHREIVWEIDIDCFFLAHHISRFAWTKNHFFFGKTIFLQCYPLSRSILCHIRIEFGLDRDHRMNYAFAKLCISNRMRNETTEI